VSVVLKVYSSKNASTSDIKVLSDSLKTMSSSVELSNPKRMIMDYSTKTISSAENVEILFSKDKKEVAKIKNDLITMYNKILAPNMKSSNKKIVEAAKNKYQLNIIELSDSSDKEE
jgi:hypothetical protein